MQKLNVVHLQYITTQASPGNRLHKAFKNKGTDSSLISLYSDFTSENIFALGKKAKYTSILNNEMESFLKRGMTNNYGIFSYPVLGSDISAIEEVQKADVIYLHWFLFGFLSFKNIEQLMNLNKPIVFFLHDMWIFTGGCHYSFDCDKFTNHCNNCQFFPKEKEKDLSYKEFEKKRKLFSKYDNLHYVSPSKWLYECTKKATLTKDKPLFHIPNVLDKNMFKPFDKKVAKEILNIDVQETVIAFGAISVDSPYKGWAYLQEALQLLSEDDKYMNITVLIFGSGYNKEIAERIPFKIKFVGFLSSEYATNVMYNAADLFVAPSLADNLPYTIMESEYCGTPVVAFNTGGIPDLIKHKANGYLANYKDSQDLAEGIKYCIDNKLRGYALPAFNEESIMKKHLDLIDQIKN